MKKFYVIGNNTSKSLSPIIFNYWFKKYNIRAKYGFVEIKKENINKEIDKLLKNKDLFGLNITIPFKQKIMKHVDILNPHAAKINAVNCIKKSKRGVVGFNTDWSGYGKALPKVNNLNTKKILILGYGGAAKAIHYFFISKNVKNIDIANRSKKRIKFIKKIKYSKNYKGINKQISSANIIINTTPNNPLTKTQINLVKKSTIVSDIVYNPRNTAFLNQFPSNKKVHGISMLLHQAIPCFKIWFGFNPSVDKKLLQILNKKISWQK